MAIIADNAPNLAGSVITLTILAFITYGMRMYCRISRKSWGAEDWIMTAAVVCVICQCLGQSAADSYHETGTVLRARGGLPWGRIQWYRHS